MRTNGFFFNCFFKLDIQIDNQEIQQLDNDLRLTVGQRVA